MNNQFFNKPRPRYANPALTGFMQAKHREYQIRDLKKFLGELHEFMTLYSINSLDQFEDTHYSKFLDLIQHNQIPDKEIIDVESRNLSA